MKLNFNGNQIIFCNPSDCSTQSLLNFTVSFVIEKTHYSLCVTN